MPGIFAVKLQKPDLSAPDGWSGLITQVFSAQVTRGINRAGSYSVSFPMTANEADQVRRGWRCTILQERLGVLDSAGDPFTPPALLYQGKVLRRTPIVADSGAVTMVLEGETYMGQLADRQIQTETVYTEQGLDDILSALLDPLGITYSVPARCVTMPITVTFSDISVLGALIRLAELSRTNLVDNFDNSIRFTDIDNLPDPSVNVCTDTSVLRVINVERATVETMLADREGFAVVVATPGISHNGDQLANRIKVIGTDFEGGPLTLQDAPGGDGLVRVGNGGSGTISTLGNASRGNSVSFGYASGSLPARFPVVQKTAPSTELYYVVEDLASQYVYGLTEIQLVRSDVKVVNNDQTSRDAARRAGLAIANGELLRRRSEIMTFNCQVAGEDSYALPGEKVYLRYKGNIWDRDARELTTIDIDRWMLVARRYDSAGQAGNRLIAYDLTTPEFAYSIPGLPDEISIETPRERQLAPEKEPTDPPTDEEPMMEDFYPYQDDYSWDEAQDNIDDMTNIGKFQSCCPDPTTDVHEGNDGIPLPPGAPEGDPGTWDAETPDDTFNFPTEIEARFFMTALGQNPDALGGGWSLSEVV